MAGIYIHIPFCKKKCIYCNFYSIVSTKLIEQYINTLCKEISNRSKENKENIETIYFGGGTPTVLPINLLEKILFTTFDSFVVNKNAEITIEANPEQLTKEYLEALKKIGFNRLSIGIQSFNDEILHFLGRTHSAKDAINAINNAQKVGFNNISIDLIYSIYLRNIADWEQELEKAFSLNIQHLSAYALTVEENTLLHKRISQQKFLELDEEQVVNELETLINCEQKNNFEHYEVSNFALPNFESKHNSNYWNRTPYLGFGASAHSYSGNKRSWNIANVEKYLHALETNLPFTEEEQLTETDQYNEFVMLGLRTKRGVDLYQVEILFGEEKIQHLLKALKKIEVSFYQIDNEILTITKKGLPLMDHTIAQLFSE